MSGGHLTPALSALYTEILSPIADVPEVGAKFALPG
jgi:hypothetical protein